VKESLQIQISQRSVAIHTWAKQLLFAKFPATNGVLKEIPDFTVGKTN